MTSREASPINCCQVPIEAPGKEYLVNVVLQQNILLDQDHFIKCPNELISSKKKKEKTMSPFL